MHVETSSHLFSLGDCFDSFSAVEDKIKLYESTKYVKFWKREARTIESARKRIDRQLNGLTLNIAVFMEVKSSSLKKKE